MNLLFRYAAMAAIAVSLIGCGDKSCSKNAAAEEVSLPKVVQGAEIALLYRDNDSPALESLLELVKTHFKKQIAKEKNAKEAQEFLKKSGLEKGEVKWIVSSIGDVDTSTFANNPDLSSLAVVAKIRHNSSSIVDLFMESVKTDDTATFEVVEISELKAVKINPKKKETANEHFFFMSYNDSILIFAGSEDMLKKQIAMYRDNAPSNPAFDAVIEDEEIVLGCSIFDFGKLLEQIRKSSPEDAALSVDGLLGQLNYKDFKVLDLGVKANRSGEVSGIVEIETGCANDAGGLAALVRTGVMAVNAALGQQAENQSDPTKQIAVEAINSIRVESEGARFKFMLPVPDMAVKLFIKEIEKEFEKKDSERADQ